MMDWRRTLLRNSSNDIVTLLLLLGCLATVAVARNHNRDRERTTRLPETTEECESSGAAELCLEEQRQKQRDNPFNFCNDLMMGRVERKMRNCLENMLQRCSEDVQNEQQDVLRNGVVYMQETCYEPEYTEHADDTDTDNSECDLIEIVSCLQPLLQAAGMQEDLMTGITLLTNPSAMALNQQQFCSALELVNLEEIHSCVGEVDRKCTAQSGSHPTDSVRNEYNITQTFTIIQQICEPGCENLNDRINAIDLCTQHMAETMQNCKQIQDGISCAAEQIRCCNMLESQYTRHLQQSNLLSQCPELLVSLACGGSSGRDPSKGGHTADNYQGDQHQASSTHGDHDRSGARSSHTGASITVTAAAAAAIVLSIIHRHFHTSFYHRS